MKWIRAQATATPSNRRWAEIGLMGDYETKEQSLVEINATFDELFGIVEHLAVLDMAASFEKASLRRIATRVGEARTILSESGKKGKSAEHLRDFLRDPNRIEDLASIEVILGNFVDAALIDQLTIIRRARNSFAHGTDILSAPTIDADATRKHLSDALNAI